MNFIKSMNFNRIKLALSAVLGFCLIVAAGRNTYAAPSAAEDYLSLAEDRKSLPIQSNQIENWPAGPAIGA